MSAGMDSLLGEPANEPNTRDQPQDNIEKTCVDAGTYAKITPVRHDLSATASPITIVGAFQANP
jgi:hypothetical protein